MRESSIPISDDFIDEEFDREAEITPEVRPDTRNTASTTSDRQHLGDCDNKNNGNRESEINGCHSGSIGEDLDYLDVDGEVLGLQFPVYTSCACSSRTDLA